MRGRSRDYPSFPEIEAELGYNPARFLDHEIKRTECTKDLTIRGLIRGIQAVATLRAWIEIEVALERGRNGGPRQQVITWLNRRQAQIEASDNVPSTAADDKDRFAASAEPAPTETTADAIDGNDTDDPRCPTCGEGLMSERIAGQLGYWYCEYRDFREPATDPPSPSMPAPSTDTDSESATTVATDGGASDPDSPPQCPDCHGKLPEETVGDDEATWCAYCGTLKSLGGPA